MQMATPDASRTAGVCRALPCLLPSAPSLPPARLNTSAAMGTVELTGFEMMATHASGQATAMALHRVATMPALMLNRSSRVMPGLRGTPAASLCGGSVAATAE
jgi:hypothetical protein